MLNGNLKQQLRKVRLASQILAATSHNQRQKILANLAALLRSNLNKILFYNQKDVKKFDPSDSMIDRLLLTKARIESMAKEIESIMRLVDPIGQKYDNRIRHGLKMHRQRVPFGVIGIVYESRPNVTTDVVSICLKAGNAVVLKGGHEAKHSNKMLMQIIYQALKQAKVTTNAVQMLDPEKRDLVKELITADRYIDLVIPRGSQGLIDFVRKNSTVPVIETGAGVCHTFVDKSAELKKSAEIVFNAKVQRPNVCNALDTLLAHQEILSPFLFLVGKRLKIRQVEIYADPPSYKILKRFYPLKLLHRAKPKDFGREFLSLRMSIKAVKNIEQAINHIQRHSSRHSEAILTNSSTNKKYFIQNVDAAVVYANASTRFSDGAIFGLGSEIGNSTQKLHARGPMGPAEMTTYKWIVEGNYTPRPN